MPHLYIGLMSGTSMDGIDAALVDFSSNRPRLLATRNDPYPEDIRQKLYRALELGDPQKADLQELDDLIGACFATTAKRLIAECGITADEIRAIGSHGQTIRHEPDIEKPYSLQIGNPDLIADITGVDVVSDFRNADIRAGGQGAPLVPAFHKMFFSSATENRVILNIGGIANITVLPDNPDKPVTGFDTGPGNTLLDNWIQLQRNELMDTNGQWAASGSVSGDLLGDLLSDPYFDRKPPKSTGPEHFNIDWLMSHALAETLEARDVQATLCALTGQSIVNALTRHAPDTVRLLVCGGGAYNGELMRQLQRMLPGIEIESTAAYGLKPDWVEAVAFAWLAKMRLEERPGNVPEVTGAKRSVLLGTISRHPTRET